MPSTYTTTGSYIFKIPPYSLILLNNIISFAKETLTLIDPTIKFTDYIIESFTFLQHCFYNEDLQKINFPTINLHKPIKVKSNGPQFSRNEMFITFEIREFESYLDPNLTFGSPRYNNVFSLFQFHTTKVLNIPNLTQTFTQEFSFDLTFNDISCFVTRNNKTQELKFFNIGRQTNLVDIHFIENYDRQLQIQRETYYKTQRDFTITQRANLFTRNNQRQQVFFGQGTQLGHTTHNPPPTIPTTFAFPPPTTNTTPFSFTTTPRLSVRPQTTIFTTSTTTETDSTTTPMPTTSATPTTTPVTTTPRETTDTNTTTTAPITTANTTTGQTDDDTTPNTPDSITEGAAAVSNTAQPLTTETGTRPKTSNNQATNQAKRLLNATATLSKCIDNLSTGDVDPQIMEKIDTLVQMYADDFGSQRFSPNTGRRLMPSDKEILTSFDSDSDFEGQLKSIDASKISISNYEED